MHWCFVRMAWFDAHVLWANPEIAWVFALVALAQHLSRIRHAVCRIDKPLALPQPKPCQNGLRDRLWRVFEKIGPAAERVIAGRIELSILHLNPWQRSIIRFSGAG